MDEPTNTEQVADTPAPAAPPGIDLDNIDLRSLLLQWAKDSEQKDRRLDLQDRLLAQRDKEFQEEKRVTGTKLRRRGRLGAVAVVVALGLLATVGYFVRADVSERHATNLRATQTQNELVATDKRVTQTLDIANAATGPAAQARSAANLQAAIAQVIGAINADIAQLEQQASMGLQQGQSQILGQIQQLQAEVQQLRASR